MNPRNKPLLFAGAAIIAGLILVLVLRGTGNPQGLTAEDAAPAEAAQTQQAPAQQPLVAPAESYPWDTPAMAGGVAPPAAISTPGTTASPPPMQPEAVNAMREQIARSGAAADSMLRKLDEMEATGQLPKEIDLPALRGNIAIAKRAQALSLEIVNLNQQPSTPERNQRLQSILAELQQLQGQLRLDVSRPVAQTATGGR